MEYLEGHDSRNPSLGRTGNQGQSASGIRVTGHETGDPESVGKLEGW